LLSDETAIAQPAGPLVVLPITLNAGLQPTHPSHRFSEPISKGIYSKVSSQRKCPTQSSWTRSRRLSQQRKHSSRGPCFCARRQQAEVANRVSVAVWNVFRQSGYEFLRCI